PASPVSIVKSCRCTLQIGYFFSSPVSNQSTDRPNSRLMAQQLSSGISQRAPPEKSRPALLRDCPVPDSPAYRLGLLLSSAPFTRGAENQELVGFVSHILPCHHRPRLTSWLT